MRYPYSHRPKIFEGKRKRLSKYTPNVKQNRKTKRNEKTHFDVSYLTVEMANECDCYSVHGTC